MLTKHSIDNDDKLREKVDEALNVYNEYLGAGSNNPSNANAEGGEAKTEGAPADAQADGVKA